MKYLSEEEQYKEILSNEELSMIKDYELREIRTRYWNKIHQAFLDEHNISDEDLEDVYDKLRDDERKEIEEYKLKEAAKQSKESEVYEFDKVAEETRNYLSKNL